MKKQINHSSGIRVGGPVQHLELLSLLERSIGGNGNAQSFICSCMLNRCENNRVCDGPTSLAKRISVWYASSSTIATISSVAGLSRFFRTGCQIHNVSETCSSLASLLPHDPDINSIISFFFWLPHAQSLASQSAVTSNHFLRRTFTQKWSPVFTVSITS